MLGEHFPVRGSQGMWDVKRKEDMVPVHPGVLGATWGSAEPPTCCTALSWFPGAVCPVTLLLSCAFGI